MDDDSEFEKGYWYDTHLPHANNALIEYGYINDTPTSPPKNMFDGNFNENCDWGPYSDYDTITPDNERKSEFIKEAKVPAGVHSQDTAQQALIDKVSLLSELGGQYEVELTRASHGQDQKDTMLDCYWNQGDPR